MSLMGAQLAPLCPPADLAALLHVGAKLVRYQITWAGPIEILNAWSPEQWRAFVRQHCDHVDTLLPLLKAKGAKLVLDLHHPCGGFADGEAAMFSSRPELASTVCQMWVEMAVRYARTYEVVAYDLLNEPACNDGDVVAEFYARLLPQIRAVAPAKRVIVSPPYGFAARMNELKAVDGPTWYTAHLYDPLTYTHQGIAGLPPRKLTNSISESAAKAVGRVRSWQRQHQGATIYIGEFSVSTTARESDRVRYLSEIIKYCERYRWHWTYHAWREAQCWSAETPGVSAMLKSAWRDN